MARMHTRRKGKSGSSRPLVTENPSWVPIEEAEIVDLIVKHTKNGVGSARIGLILRDQYGVPDVKLATGRTITQIIKDEDLMSAIPEDMTNLMTRAISLNAHLKEHKGDVANRRGLNLIEAKIRRLERYYKANDVLPKDWKYSLKNAELMLK